MTLAINGQSPADRLGSFASKLGTSIDATLPPAIVPNYITAGELIAENEELRAFTIDGLLRSGEVLNIIAAAKMGKSWLIIHLILCIASGRMFLGRFRVSPGKVLLIDNELHPQTLAKRIKTVADAMGIIGEEYASNLCIESMRGKGATLDRLVDYFAAIPPGTFKLTVIDAWYRAIPRGMDENANADITALYNLIDSFAAMTDSAFALIHHSSKGDQSGKTIVEVGSGASAQARAADAHLIIRQHEEDDAVVVEAVARSWAPPEAFGMRWSYPLWTVDESLDVTMLRKPPSRRRVAAGDLAPDAPPPEPWTGERFVAAYVTGEPKPTETIIALATTGTDLSQRKARSLLTVAENAGIVHRWPRVGRGPERFATRQPDLVSDFKGDK